ncbi:MAG: hypothetical protein MUQ32_15740 [Chloroflexi bacterium]|nr:hypothetical protein [Chloroflexota bacterium]
MSGQHGNGAYDPADDEDLDDDAPLGIEEEAEAAAEALAEADETLDERVEAVMEDLEGVDRLREDESVTYLHGGRTFAVQLPDLLEVALDPAVAKAALRTPNTLASRRGAGWIAFTPEVIDRFALDRAEAGLRSAYRRVAGG